MEGSPEKSGKYYAAIISDVNMPVMNGMNFIKSNELYPTIKKRFYSLQELLIIKISYLNQNNLSYLLKISPVKI